MYLGCWEQPCERWEKTIQISHHQQRSGCSTHVLRVWRLMHQRCNMFQSFHKRSFDAVGKRQAIRNCNGDVAKFHSLGTAAQLQNSAQQQVMSGWPWDICHESRWMDRHSSPYLETWKLQHWNLNAYLRLVMIFSASSPSSIASTLFCLLSVADLMFWRWAAQHCWLPGWSFAAPGALLWVLPWSERGEHHLHRGEEMGTR